MALDAVLLEGVLAGGVPALRLYAWEPACLSLGYFQEPGAVCDLGFLHSHGLGLARRMTGGGAILHQHEITLALALPLDHPAAHGSLEQSYAALSAPVLSLLEGLGVPAALRGQAQAGRHAANCFAGSARTDLLAGGAKLFGSAQRRKGKALLFHGSLLLSIDTALWRGVFRGDPGQGFTSLEAALGGPAPARRDLERSLAARFAEALRLDFTESVPQALELDEMHRLRSVHEVDPTLG
jgi:lipoate-protein ligase A